MSDQAARAAAELGGRAVSNTLIILAARVVSQVVALVVLVALANALGDTAYGRYTTLIAYSALVSVIADLGFNPLYTREAARKSAGPGRLPRDALAAEGRAPRLRPDRAA